VPLDSEMTILKKIKKKPHHQPPFDDYPLFKKLSQ